VSAAVSGAASGAAVSTGIEYKHVEFILYVRPIFMLVTNGAPHLRIGGSAWGGDEGGEHYD
jgi:hypothetical protein